MTKKKPGKPTMKDVTTTIDQMMANMNWLKNNLDMVGRLFDLYVESKGDTDSFKEFLENRQKEYEEAQEKIKEDANEQPADESSDEGNNSSGDSNEE